MTMMSNIHPNMPPFMRRIHCICTLLLTVVLAACGERTENLAEAEWVRSNEREYVTTWSAQGVPVLEVSLSYHGKEPNLPFNGPEPGHDWRSRDTDFYSCALRNLTDQPIRLRTVRLKLDQGTSGNKGPQGGSYLVERWGNDIISPGGTLTRPNTWVWGKGSRNTLTKTYEAEIVHAGESSANPALTALLEGEGDGSYLFSFQTPLLYKR